jgi:hypothetical protein
MARLIPLEVGSDGQNFLGITRCPSSFRIGLIPVHGHASG